MPVNATHKQISIASLLEILRRRKIFVLVPALLGTVLAFLFATRQSVRYKGDALLGIDSGPAYVQNDNDAANPAKVQDYLLTIREALYSRTVLDPLAREFNLYPSAAADKLSDSDLEDLKTRIKIQVEGEDSFHVTFEAPTAAQSMDVTNRAAGLFVARLSGLRKQQVTDTAQTISAELETLRRKLSGLEQTIGNYKQHAANSLPDRVDGNFRAMETLQNERQLRMDRQQNDEARLAAVKEEMTGLEKQGVLQPPPKEKSPAELRLDDMKMQLHGLQSTHTDDYPDIVRLKQEIQNLQRAIAAMPPSTKVPEPSASRLKYGALKAEKEQIEQRLRGYVEENHVTQAKIDQLQGRVQSAPVHESALQSLQRDYDTTKQRYNDLLAKQEEAHLATRMQKSRTVGFRIIEPASLPPGPSTPPRSRLLLMGLFASLGLGLVIAFVAEQLDSSFDSVDAFQDFTDLPLLCGLPAVSGRAQQGVQPKQGTVEAHPPCEPGVAQSPLALPLRTLYQSRVVSLTDPHAVASEQYRILALKIRKQLEEVESPAVALTSAIGGEGKTLTSLNLAFALVATSPRPVLLLEGDLRKPRLHEYLGLRPSKGFSDLLLKPDAPIDQYVWKINDLYVMPGGASLANPVELLTSPATRHVLERLRENFGFVLIDAPPVLPIVDTHILAGLVNGVVIVVRARYTKRELFQRAMESFQISNLLGAAVNDVDYERSRYAYAYKYHSKNYSNGT